jgi:hypothetical protein
VDAIDRREARAHAAVANTIRAVVRRCGEASTPFVAPAATFDMSIRQNQQNAANPMLTLAC